MTSGSPMEKWFWYGGLVISPVGGDGYSFGSFPVCLWNRTERDSFVDFPYFLLVLQQNTNPLNRGPLQILPHQGSPEQSGTGLGLVRVTEGVGLRFTVDNLPTSMEYQLVIHYESEVRRTSGSCLWTLKNSQLYRFYFFIFISIYNKKNIDIILNNVSIRTRHWSWVFPFRCQHCNIKKMYCPHFETRNVALCWSLIQEVFLPGLNISHLPLQSVTDWVARVNIITLSPGDGGCSDDPPSGSLTLILPRSSRWVGLREQQVIYLGSSHYDSADHFLQSITLKCS